MQNLQTIVCVALLVLCGCGSKPESVSSAFTLSEDKERTQFVNSLGNIGNQYGFNTIQKASKEECEKLAWQMVKISKAARQITFTKVYVESPASGIPYFRFCWHKPDGVKIGDYDKYVVKFSEYDN